MKVIERLRYNQGADKMDVNRVLMESLRPHSEASDGFTT